MTDEGRQDRGRDPERPVEETPEGPALACSLGAASMRQRGERIADLARHSTARARERSHLTVRFPESAEEAVRALAAEESQCCGFMDLRVARVGDEVELRITAPSAAARPTLDLFAEAFGMP